jgi:hypothetical protein
MGCKIRVWLSELKRKEGGKGADLGFWGRNSWQQHMDHVVDAPGIQLFVIACDTCDTLYGNQALSQLNSMRIR